MKHYFPPQNQSFTYLQSNRSNKLGSLWSTFNLDFQSNFGVIRIANKLVTNTTSSDDADLGLPVAFEFWFNEWWAVAGTRIFRNGSPELTAGFTEDTTGWEYSYIIGDNTSQFSTTNPGGTTYRYTWTGVGTDPGITTITVPVGSVITLSGGSMSANNKGTFTVTGSGTNFVTPLFLGWIEVTNASGSVESNKTLANFTLVQTFSSPNFSAILSDLALFNDRIWATSPLALWSKSFFNVAWQRMDILASSSAARKMVYFKRHDRLYYVNNSTSSSTNIRSIDNLDVVSTTGDFTLKIGTSIGYMSTMVATTNSIWIGTFRDNTQSDSGSSGLFGSINQWDGISPGTTIEYALTTSGVLAMCVYQDVPYALDTEGRVLKYTGYSFEEIARLPINRTLLTMSSAFGTSKFVHFNGMTATKNNTILININNLNEDVQADISENIASGIWELDLATNNFTHKYAPTLKARSSSTITDYGQNRISSAGAVKTNTLQSASANGRSTLIAGFNYFTDATTIKSGIFIDSPDKPTTNVEGQKRGYFVTTWFNSNEITDNWTRIWATYRRFLNSADKICLKFRLNEEEATLATITWTSTTTFTTTTDVSAYAPTVSPFLETGGITGGEVEILQGTGSGSNTHITSVAFSTPTYTVTLDTAVTGVTGTAKARFQKWIKLGEITGQVLQYGSFPIAKTNTRIQIKCSMEFTGDDELHKLILNSEDDLKAIS